jgi:hypothetical protein
MIMIIEYVCWQYLMYSHKLYSEQLFVLLLVLLDYVWDHTHIQLLLMTNYRMADMTFDLKLLVEHQQL